MPIHKCHFTNFEILIILTISLGKYLNVIYREYIKNVSYILYINEDIKNHQQIFKKKNTYQAT